MNDKKRMGILLGVLVLLAVVNIANWMGDEGFEGPGFFADNPELDFSPKFARTVEELDRIPLLNFGADRTWEPVNVTGQRNPFIFGLDRRQEEVRRQRMEDLEKQREAMTADLPEPVPVEVKPQFNGRVVGVMTDSRDGASMVSFSYNQEIHIIKEGQILAEKYRLVAVEDERILLLALETGEEIEIQVQTR